MQSALNHLVKRFQNNIDLIVACVLAIVSTCVIGFDQDRIETKKFKKIKSLANDLVSLTNNDDFKYR